MIRKQRDPEVFRITGARQSLADDVRGRQRRYVISMLVRTASVLLTVLLWDVQRPLAVLTLVLGAGLPYVAVVIANAGRENAPSLPSTYLPPPSRPALTGDVHGGAEEGGERGAESAAQHPAEPSAEGGPECRTEDAAEACRPRRDGSAPGRS